MKLNKQAIIIALFALTMRAHGENNELALIKENGSLMVHSQSKGLLSPLAKNENQGFAADQLAISKKIFENRLALIKNSFSGLYRQIAYAGNAVLEKMAQLFGFFKKMTGHDDLEKFLFCGQYWLDRKKDSQLKDLIKKDTVESQVFAKEQKILLENGILNDKKPFLLNTSNRITFFNKILPQAKTEQCKKRSIGYHSRKSRQFVPDQIFKKLLELYHQKPIKNSWHTLHHKLPHEYLTYENAYEQIDKGYQGEIDAFVVGGRHATFESNMLYMSPLFSTFMGEDALGYMVSNNNQERNKSAHNIMSLFTLFGSHMKKYYEKYSEKIEQLVQKSMKLKYGTLLLVSVEKNLSDTFCFASKYGCGIKSKIPFSEKETTSMYETCEIMKKEYDINNIVRAVFIMALSQDGKDGKVGTTNPFNPDIDIYHFNIGDDEKIAKEIEQGVDEIFKKIREDMVKDGLLKDTSAWNKTE